ncbi:hypothetical protein AB4Z51_13420 [Bradyrhizobium sp. 2TAF36]|uniref:hypothetical protein n=1 Tax=Bradyrhizobium sp. 2TAF36 TaxID=3233016 RepID=UPI003F939ED2
MRGKTALLQRLKRNHPNHVKVTIDNIVAAGELVKSGDAEPVEIANVLYVQLPRP